MQISNIVISKINEFVEENDINTDAITVNSRLFGGNGILDSIGIVMLVTELEEVIDDELDVEIVLADERAMSQKTSPFRSVDTLIKYIELLVSENK
jgi:acyl carrier protein